jgi:hypothetical protein
MSYLEDDAMDDAEFFDEDPGAVEEVVSVEIVPASRTGLLILPDKKEIEKLGVSSALHWISVVYNMAAFSRKIGNALAGERFEVDHVFGRCAGERSDHKTFFATVIIPWLWEDDSYDWRRIARERLETFLDPSCQCDARTEETKVCPYHLELMGMWESDDRSGLYRVQNVLKSLPAAKEGAGTFPRGESMHRDYPWCREFKDEVPVRWECTICGFGKDPLQALGNPTYRNIFIRDHSHCGFKNPPPTVDELIKKESVAIAKRLNEEAIKPKTPVSGHAVGCVCHRCRVYYENKKIEELNFNFRKAEAVCDNCKKGVYRKDGVWWHLTLLRTCDLTGLTVAQA